MKNDSRKPRSSRVQTVSKIIDTKYRDERGLSTDEKEFFRGVLVRAGVSKSQRQLLVG